MYSQMLSQFFSYIIFNRLSITNLIMEHNPFHCFTLGSDDDDAVVKSYVCNVTVVNRVNDTINDMEISNSSNETQNSEKQILGDEMREKSNPRNLSENFRPNMNDKSDDWSTSDESSEISDIDLNNKSEKTLYNKVNSNEAKSEKKIKYMKCVRSLIQLTCRKIFGRIQITRAMIGRVLMNPQNYLMLISITRSQKLCIRKLTLTKQSPVTMTT